MSYHLVANTLSMPGSTTVEQDITPVQDGQMLIQNNHFVPQFDMPLLWTIAMSAHIISARIITPSFRQITTPYIRPVELNAAPGNLAAVADYSHNPLTLKGLEEVEVNGLTGTAEYLTVLMALQRSQMMPAPSGNIYTMQGTGTTTLTAHVWNQVPITWHDSLPAGQYVCVGLSYVGTTAQAARMTFQNQWERPGVPGITATGLQERSMFRRGGLGILGQFNSYALPTIECLANAADTAQTVYLDLMKVG